MEPIIKTSENCFDVNFRTQTAKISCHVCDFHIQFQWKVTEHFGNRLFQKQIWSDPEKKSDDLEIKTSQTHFVVCDELLSKFEGKRTYSLWHEPFKSYPTDNSGAHI